MKQEEQLTIYNQKGVYEKELAPLLDKIKVICRINKIPLFYSCAISNSEDKTNYMNDGALPGSLQVSLKDDFFAQYLLILQGAKVSMTSCSDDELVQSIMNVDVDDDD